MPNEAVRETSVSNLPLKGRGKVRDIYDLGDRLLLVATDRISCFDVVLPTPVPGKGRVLTQMSLFWFEKLGHVVRNHFVSTDVSGVAPTPGDREVLEGRSMIVRKATPLPVEAIVRGYLSGSAWKEYSARQTVCGLEMPPGLRESDKLPQTLFTPSTKAEQGEHDENISYDEMAGVLGNERAEELRRVSLALYEAAARHARERGIIIADTKFEFGTLDGELMLIDEVLTPDSSRFWPADGYEPGGAQPSFDKQYVRDYLLSLDWDKTPPAPELPSSVVEKTVEKYSEALGRLTGHAP
jgi:phosphoribosylaminoimidazole-succinocarboxamide synthase